jgi:hypothetical protein
MTDPELEQLADHIEAEWYRAPKPAPYAKGPGRIQIVLDAPAQLLTMNAAKSMHHRPWSDLTRAWRHAACQRAQFLEIPSLSARVGIEARPLQYGGILADPGAHMPCVKAIIDGLRDAEVLVDDTGEHIAWIQMHAPIKAEGAGMVIEIVRVEL